MDKRTSWQWSKKALKSLKLFGLFMFAMLLWGSLGVSTAMGQTVCNANNPYRSLTDAFAESNKAGVCRILHDGDTQGKLNQINLFPNLTELQIWGDHAIEAIPPEIGQLKKLQKINLRGSKIKTLPTTFSALGSESATGFIDIDIRSSALTTLPDNFGAFMKPITLTIEGKPWDAVGDGLQQLPESFGQLRIRGTLDLSFNRLKELPASFGKLTAVGTDEIEPNHLLEILLQHNQLQRLPIFERRPSGQGSIREINLSNNDLRSIRNEFEQIKSVQDNPKDALSNLILEYNPLILSQVQGLQQRMGTTRVSFIPRLICFSDRNCPRPGQRCIGASNINTSTVSSGACEYTNTALGDWCGLSGDPPVRRWTQMRQQTTMPDADCSGRRVYSYRGMRYWA